MSETSDAPVVLITGCSSGIGLASARRFARAGFRVYASVRRETDAEALRAEAAATGWRLRAPLLDVTSDESVAAAVRDLLRETSGRIDVAINNAGYYLFGPIEETSPDELRAQLETNVIGVLRVIRAVLPAMRARGAGTIVNLSSVSGRVAVPVVGPYHASKWALEALTESLRYEVAPFGVRVVAVEPGPFKTELHRKEIRARAVQAPGSPYAPLVAAYHRRSLSLHRPEVDECVEAIFDVATAARPSLRRAVGPTSFSGTVLRRFVPDALYEVVMGFAFGWRRRG